MRRGETTTSVVDDLARDARAARAVSRACEWGERVVDESRPLIRWDTSTRSIDRSIVTPRHVRGSCARDARCARARDDAAVDERAFDAPATAGDARASTRARGVERVVRIGFAGNRRHRWRRRGVVRSAEDSRAREEFGEDGEEFSRGGKGARGEGEGEGDWMVFVVGTAMKYLDARY